MLIKLDGCCFIISQKKQLLPQTLLNLFIENIHIKREHIIKFSGAFIDQNLFWNSKTFKSIGILYKSRYVLSKQSLKQLYINYANIAWASTSKSKLQHLYRCKKHAAHVIYHKDWYTYASPLLNYVKPMFCECFPGKYFQHSVFYL